MIDQVRKETVARDTAEVLPVRRRLEPTAVYPFHRAHSIETISVYWIGGFVFPMPFQVRQWFLAFVSLLKGALAARDLRQENFLRFRIIAHEQTERFLATSREYQPFAGYAIAPDGVPVKPPTSADIEKAITNGGFKLGDWVGDYTYWFLKKQDERQRQDFFGIGGMMLLWMKEDEKAKPPRMKVPPAIQGFLDEQGHDMHATLDHLYRFQDGFLAKSKAVFGTAMESDPSFAGIPFVLPLLQAKHFTEATSETLASWFEVFDGYLIESREDAGVLLAVSDPRFDGVLSSVLEQLRKDGMGWPLDDPKFLR